MPALQRFNVTVQIGNPDDGGVHRRACLAGRQPRCRACRGLDDVERDLLHHQDPRRHAAARVIPGGEDRTPRLTARVGPPLDAHEGPFRSWRPTATALRMISALAASQSATSSSSPPTNRRRRRLPRPGMQACAISTSHPGTAWALPSAASAASSPASRAGSSRSRPRSASCSMPAATMRRRPISRSPLRPTRQASTIARTGYDARSRTACNGWGSTGSTSCSSTISRPTTRSSPDDWETLFAVAEKGAFPALSALRDEGTIDGWGMGVNRPEPILRCLEVAGQ